MDKSIVIAKFALLICSPLLKINLLTEATDEDHCRSLHFTPPINEHALVNHVIGNFTVEMPGSCQTSCYLENDCVSYNLGPLKDDKYICELSNSDHTKYDDLVPRQGFMYRGTKNFCSNHLCPPRYKCQNGFTDKKYRCICKEGKNCDSDDALHKVNTDPVCFQAKNEFPGYFRMPKSGFVRRMELVHRSGQVYCSDTVPASFWGCTIPFYKDKKLQTLITFPNKTILIPPEGLLQRQGACLSYGLSGVNHDSNELVFPSFISAIPVSAGQKFNIWFEQDLNNCSEHNNSGETCADVFVRYT